MVPNARGVARWIWEIRANGTYSFRSEGPGGTPSHSGTVTFSNGQWSLQTTSGLPGWTDGGTYQFPSPDLLAVTGKLGPGVWQRSKTTGGSPSVDQWPQNVVTMAAKARTMARTKLPDAVLLDIKVEPFPDSFPRPAGVEWSYRFDFWSSSTQNTYTVMPYNPAGEEVIGDARRGRAKRLKGRGGLARVDSRAAPCAQAGTRVGARRPFLGKNDSH